MEDIVWYSISIVVVGFILGWKLSARHHMQIFGDILDALGVTESQLNAIRIDEDGQEDKPIAITVEQVGGNLYAYTKENPRFLAQGTTPEELRQSLSERLLNADVIIYEDDAGYDVMKHLNSATEVA